MTFSCVNHAIQNNTKMPGKASKLTSGWLTVNYSWVLTRRKQCFSTLQNSSTHLTPLASSKTTLLSPSQSGTSDLSMKEYNRHTVICKTVLMELRRISSFRHYLTVDATTTFVIFLVLLGIKYCNIFYQVFLSPRVVSSRECRTIQSVL